MGSSKHSVGIAVGASLGLVAGAIVLSLLQSQRGYGDILIASFAVVVGCPLLLLNLVLWFKYALSSAGVPIQVTLWMWMPLFVSLLVLGGGGLFRGYQGNVFEDRHPMISEVHINLSGRSIWLDRNSNGANDTQGKALGPLKGDEPERFVGVTRYPAGDDQMAAYEGARLSPSFKDMTVYLGERAQTPPTVMPVVARRALPDLRPVLGRTEYGGKNEARVLTYLYFHYADHVEVVPAFSLGGSQEMDLWGQDVPVVEFHIADLWPLPIARLEIDGQAVSLGDWGAMPSEAGPEVDRGCSHRNFSAQAILRLDAPLKVRWQFAQPNPQWHEATVAVPPFRSAKPPPGKPRSTSVDLYFQPDGSVAAERSQVLTQAGDKLAVRSTGPVPALQLQPACGTATGRWDQSVTRIPD